jgi:hypothetical protein
MENPMNSELLSLNNEYFDRPDIPLVLWFVSFSF